MRHAGTLCAGSGICTIKAIQWDVANWQGNPRQKYKTKKVSSYAGAIASSPQRGKYNALGEFG